MSVEVKKLEEKAAELVKRYKEYCIIPMIELFYGEDDGRNKTYEYLQKRGLPLLRTQEVLRARASVGYAEPYGGGAYRISVVGAYATADGILVQFHKVVSNRYGNPVKDYGWFMSLSSLLEVEAKKVPLEEVISAAEKDLEEWEHMLERAAKKMARSYRVDKPSGYVIAFCPRCKMLLKPNCKEGETLIFVHEHQPALIVLDKWGVKCSNVRDRNLVEIAEILWSGGERPKAIEVLVGAWILLKEQDEYEEYENNVRAFFEQL